MVRLVLLHVPLLLVTLALCAYLVLPWPVALRWVAPRTTAMIEQRKREARDAGEALDVRREWVSLDEISPHLRRVVVLAEDERFREHRGVDWRSVGQELRYAGDADFSWLDPDDLRALRSSFDYYRRNRDRVRGRSTITQQLAKNLYLSSDRSLVRKAVELAVAQRLEWFLPKDRILELYLNVAEWGPGIFGAEAAARHYFGRSAAELTPSQAAALAATLPHPLTSNPAHRPGRMRWRQELLLRRMRGGDGVRPRPVDPSPPPTLEAPPVPVPEADTLSTRIGSGT